VDKRGHRFLRVNRRN